MTKNEAIRELSTTLRNAIDIIDSKEMLEMFRVAQVHGIRWTGPTIDTTKARKLLQEAEKTTDGA